MLKYCISRYMLTSVRGVPVLKWFAHQTMTRIEALDRGWNSFIIWHVIFVTRQEEVRKRQTTCTSCNFFQNDVTTVLGKSPVSSKNDPALYCLVNLPFCKGICCYWRIRMMPSWHHWVFWEIQDGVQDGRNFMISGWYVPYWYIYSTKFVFV